MCGEWLELLDSWSKRNPELRSNAQDFRSCLPCVPGRVDGRRGRKPPPERVHVDVKRRQASGVDEDQCLSLSEHPLADQVDGPGHGLASVDRVEEDPFGPGHEPDRLHHLRCRLGIPRPHVVPVAVHRIPGKQGFDAQPGGRLQRQLVDASLLRFPAPAHVDAGHGKRGPGAPESGQESRLGPGAPAGNHQMIHLKILPPELRNQLQGAGGVSGGADGVGSAHGDQVRFPSPLPALAGQLLHGGRRLSPPGDDPEAVRPQQLVEEIVAAGLGIEGARRRLLQHQVALETLHPGPGEGQPAVVGLNGAAGDEGVRALGQGLPDGELQLACLVPAARSGQQVVAFDVDLRATQQAGQARGRLQGRRHRDIDSSGKGGQRFQDLRLRRLIRDSVCSGKQLLDRLSPAVLGDEEGPLLDLVGLIRGNAQGGIEGGVEVLDGDRVLHHAAGTLVVGAAVEEAGLESTPENQDRRGFGEVPVHAVVARLGHPVRDLDLLPHAQVRLAFDEGVPAELAGHDHDRPVQESPFLQVQDQLGEGAVDGSLEVDHPLVAVLVSVEVAKRDVPGGDLHEADARLDEPAGQKAALTEAARAVPLMTLLGLLGQVEGCGSRRIHQAVGLVQIAEQRLLLIGRALLKNRALGHQAAVGAVAARGAGPVHTLGRPHGPGGGSRIRDQHGAVLGAQEPGRVEGLERVALRTDLHVLPDVHEGGHVRTPGTQRASHHRPQVGSRHREGRRITGVPVILVAGVEDEPQVSQTVTANQGGPIHHLGQAVEAAGELDAVHHRVDGGKRAQHPFRLDARFERGVVLGVEGFGLSHASGHPEQNHGVGPSRQGWCRQKPWLRASPSRQGSGGKLEKPSSTQTVGTGWPGYPHGVFSASPDRSDSAPMLRIPPVGSQA